MRRRLQRGGEAVRGGEGERSRSHGRRRRVVRGEEQGGRGGPVGLRAGGAAPAAAVSVEAHPVVSDSAGVAAGRRPLWVLLMWVLGGQSGRGRLRVHTGRGRRSGVGRSFGRALGPGRGRRRGLSARGERQGGGRARLRGSLGPRGEEGGAGPGRTAAPVVARGQRLDRHRGAEGGAGHRRRDLLAPLLTAL